MTKNHYIRFRPGPTLQLFMAMILFVASAAVVSGGNLPLWEEAAFWTFYNLPNFVEPYLLAITQLGNIFVLFGLAIFYAVYRRYGILLKLLLSGCLAYVVSGVAKDLLGRGRPAEFFSDLVVRDYIVRGPGFPSGHAALATAIAVTLSTVLPRKHKWWVMTVLIGGVSISRVFLGVHLPMDVVGGIAVGWACGEVFKYVDIVDKTKHPKPGITDKLRKKKGKAKKSSKRKQKGLKAKK
ncbi:MAG: phosphatase PAP2 family protein [Candidatus Saccharibacteria bacterium]|nr:phosphatase PAP2 family protein [Candidatus Saccharibacteria bacterium]